MSGPGNFVDLQVNGYAGVDFNADGLEADDLHRACSAMQRDGVRGCLATFITDHPEAMTSRVRRLVRLRAADDLVRKQVVGVHIEGPFIQPKQGYVGAHPADAVMPADPDVMSRLLDAGEGLTRLVTLAPECDRGLTVTRLLTREGIVVSAGHCNPSLDELDAAIDAGLSMFTHLGNGCPMHVQRHDNVIQRALARADRLWLCFIADGVHVPVFALKNYLKLAGDRAIVVTDAMAAAGLGPGRHRLGRWEVDVDADLAAWAPDRSHLVGSAMTMQQAAANLADRVGLGPDQIDQLTRRRPAAVLRTCLD